MTMMSARKTVTPVDLGLRQGENSEAPSFYIATAGAQQRWIESLIAEVRSLRAKVEAKDRRIGDLELRLRGAAWRPAP